MSGSTCLRTTVYAGTAAYSCPSGGTLNGTTCTQTSSYTATTNYSCPNGDPLSGSTCLKTTVYAGTAAYSCPSGGSLNGGACTQTSSYAATINYSCPSGDPLSGSTCLKTTVYTATPSYSCPSGGSLNGTNCTVTSAYAATSTYSCTGADTLNGSTCTRTTTTAATSSYSCPNGAAPLNGQCTGSNSTSTAYIYLAGKQIAETVVGGATQYVHTDALGSPVAHTNQAGAETSRTKFEPYGYTAGGTKPGPAMAGVPTTGSAIGFTGHVNDPETDLVYMQQRYYDPVAGRFLSIDPVVTDANTGGSFNRYAYANNSPYNYIDPDGRLAFLLPLVPYVAPYVATASVAILVHYVLPGRQGREYSARKLGNAILNSGSKDSGTSSEGGKAGAKPPKDTQPITNPPQAPVIPPDRESKPGRNGGEVFYPPGTNPADGEHIRVMPPGSSPVPGYEDGYWRWVNGNKQPMDPSTGKPGKGQGDTHVPLPPDSIPPPRR